MNEYIKIRTEETKKTNILRVFKVIEVLLFLSVFIACWFNLLMPQMPTTTTWRDIVFVFVLYFVGFVFFIRTFSGFDIENLRIREIIFSQILSIFFINICSFFAFLFVLGTFKQVLIWIAICFADAVIAIIWSYFSNKLYYKVLEIKNSIVFYESTVELQKLEAIPFLEKKFNIVLKTNKCTCFRDIISSNTQADTVFVCGVNSNVRNELVKYCLDLGIKTYVLPSVSDLILRGSEADCVSGQIFVTVQRPPLTIEYLFIKRCIDILASLFGIVILSPIMLIVALLIKVYDGGPVFYKQTRLTKNSKEFRILKFRSMRVDAEKDGVARLSSENDSRITPIGKFIRACRFDELPQLFNILKGDMTIVGPRPERPEIANEYYKTLPAFSLRLQVKAGLTGYAQVYGRYNSEPYEKLQMDLFYIGKMSLLEDIKLMFATVRILFMKESTSGIKEGNVTAQISREE